jgi:hypothetical protein
MAERHKYFKELLCPLHIIDSNTKTEDSSESALTVYHNIWPQTPEYCIPGAKLNERLRIYLQSFTDAGFLLP